MSVEIGSLCSLLAECAGCMEATLYLNGVLLMSCSVRISGVA